MRFPKDYLSIQFLKIDLHPFMNGGSFCIHKNFIGRSFSQDVIERPKLNMFHKRVYVIVFQFNELNRKNKWNSKHLKSFTKFLTSMQHGINEMYNNCGRCNFFPIA